MSNKNCIFNDLILSGIIFIKIRILNDNILIKMMLNDIILINIIYATCNIPYLIYFSFSRIILYVDIILGNEIKFFSRVTCISVRPSTK